MSKRKKYLLAKKAGRRIVRDAVRNARQYGMKAKRIVYDIYADGYGGYYACPYISFGDTFIIANHPLYGVEYDRFGRRKKEPA